MKKLCLLLYLLLLPLYSDSFENVNEYFEKNAMVMLLIDPKSGEIVRANHAASSFYGYPLRKLESMSIKEINTFTKEQVQEEMQKAKEENRNYFIFRHRLANDEIKRVEVYSYPILYNKRKLLFSTIQDVTILELAQQEIQDYNRTLEEQIDLKSKELIQEEIDKRNIFIGIFILELVIIALLFKNIFKRKQVERELESSLRLVEESKHQLQEIINSFPIAIGKADPSFTYVDYFNKAFYKLFGWEKGDINTLEKWYDKAYPNKTQREEIKQQWQELMEETKQLKLCTSQRAIRTTIQAKDKSQKECLLWYHQNAGEIYGIFHDITKQTELEKENLEQQKLLLTQAKIAAVGEMLGNIAHQWRQPLSSISSQVSGLCVQLDFGVEISNDDIKECSKKVINQVQYLSTTIDDFKNFFTSDLDCVEPFSVKDTIDKLQGLIKDTLNNNYIIAHLDLEDIEVCHNENKLVQCLLNICNNAKDAMIYNKLPTDERHLFITLYQNGDMAKIKIKDSGGGVNTEIMDKIFEPYFTTKHKSVGTGIGLYMAYQMITTSFGGQLKVKNKTYEFEGKEYSGAEFTIEFPLKKEQKFIKK